MPDTVGYPNGDTPLPNGHLLLSETYGGWVDEVTADGHVVWSRQIPGVSLPSDPQRLADGSYLVASYVSPGAVVRFDRSGKVLWTYRPISGPGMLDHPSLAAPLPNGLIAINDDYNHRVVLVDPKTDRIVWQYGTGVAGTGVGQLAYPDGIDLLLPGGVIPLHVDFDAPTVHHGKALTDPTRRDGQDGLVEARASAEIRDRQVAFDVIERRSSTVATASSATA